MRGRKKKGGEEKKKEKEEEQVRKKKRWRKIKERMGEEAARMQKKNKLK